MNAESRNIANAYMSHKEFLSFPKGDLWQRMREGAIQDRLKEEVAALPFDAGDGELPRPVLPQDDFESLYINSFEVGYGGGKPPYPLYEGLWRSDEGREGILMDLLRFYDYFDVKLAETERDFPDHLLTEIEFMAYLAGKESIALDAGAYRLAQRDFLERHLGRWVPGLAKKLEKMDEEPFYGELCSSLARLVEGHLTYLKAQEV